jgi:murein DD-endopeptidase MepM/ murein hydrolase activator NlpD
VYLRNDQELEFAGGAAAVRAPTRPSPPDLDRLRTAAAAIDWTPDLGADIGTAAWWRGLFSCTALCALALSFAPDLRPVPGHVPAPLEGAEWDEARTLGIAPLGLGSGTGRRLAANDLVRPLANAPERPSIELAATLGDGDSLDRVLQRAGVGRGDAQAAAALLSQAVPLDALEAGTRIAVTLGRRTDRTAPRPLDRLALRARFDMDVSIDRSAGGLALTRRPIAVDRTPLRIQGLVGASLYRSARAAGAPARAVEGYLRALATRLSVGRDVQASDRFDLIVARKRAATGEVRLGELLYAGLEQANRRTQLVRHSAADDGEEGVEGVEGWFDGAGRSERRGHMGMPVAGRISSGFGFRLHPILGFLRLHKGLDIAAPHGSPVYAAVDGVVQFAGRNGGYGNYVKLAHGQGLSSAYGHLSRIAVGPGERVRRGEVIGHVGSTGMSSGPHLHWEVWRDGRPVNPRSISFDRVTRLSGEALRAFRARAEALLRVPVAAR